ncbi:MAG: DUF1565 domain-containing protein, partial [Kovacikia sp.]
MSFAPPPRDRIAKFWNLPTPKSGLFFWLPTAACLGFTGIVPLALQQSPVIAQTASSPHSSQAAQKGSIAPFLMVNPITGNDTTADGSDRAPFKTITQALQTAPPNALIQLGPGTYSEETGEKFPLALKPGITLQGNPQSRGSDTVIQGGGFILSPTAARQNVTIVGAAKAIVIGVTLTNPHPQGYGLWIESTRLTVTDSTFTASGHDGISVTGDSAPLIRNNYFYQNGANGITVYGTSRPEIRENIFEQTGFAINLNQNSAPLIIGNRITQNKDGIVVQANSRPVLRNNSIERNERDGLVAIAQSRPDLGTADEPGGNFIRNNGQYDINVQASNQAIPAFGNELDQTLGALDLAGKGQGTAAVTALTPAASSPLPTVLVAALSPNQANQPTTAAPQTPVPSAENAIRVRQSPTLAAPSPAPTSSIAFGERLSSPGGAAPLPPPTSQSTAAVKSPAPPLAIATPSASPFPIPTALSGKEDSPNQRPFQLVRLVSSEPSSKDGGKGRDPGNRGNPIQFSATSRLPSSASPSNSGKTPTTAPATFPVPSLLTTVNSERVAIVPNSPPVSLAIPVSESPPNLLLNSEPNQAAALGKRPVQIQLPNFERKGVPPIAPAVTRSKLFPMAANSATSNPAANSAASDGGGKRSVTNGEKPPSPDRMDSPDLNSNRSIEIPVPAPESRSRPIAPAAVVPPPAPAAPAPTSAARTEALSLLPVPDSN